MDKKTPIVLNADLFWANLQQRNELSGKYQVNLSNLSSGAVAALEERGLNVNNKNDDQGSYIVTKSQNPIKAYNTSGDEIMGNVGNGSKAKVAISYFDWEFSGKKGRSPSLIKLIVTDLEEYESANVADLDLEAAL
jgi:hypothetical protein|tara:strand:- start:10174 stop:10581 length:408 start_codon:yes stop_codon:yes gene_type:complete